MAGRALPVPEPVLDSDGDVAMFTAEIAATLRHGEGLQGCVVCQGGTMMRWPLGEVATAVEAEGPRVVMTAALGGGESRRHHYNRHVPHSWATLPDEVGLHSACVPGVLDAWAWMVHGDPVTEHDGPAATRPARGTARRQGAYGRRRA